MKRILRDLIKLYKNQLSPLGKKKLFARCSHPKNVSLVILGSWSFFFILFLTLSLTLTNLDSVGQFGDFFGSLNTLFSGAALAGVILSLMMQRKELRLQRREMQLTRSEMEDQREVMENQKNALADQARILEKQNFDSLFFSLFSAHNDLKNNLECRDCSNLSITYKGHNVFIAFAHALDENFGNQKGTSQMENKILQLMGNNYSFEPYVRSLEQLLTVIKNNSGVAINKQDYFKLVRGSISTAEKLPIFFFCSSSPDTHLAKFAENHFLLSGLEQNFSSLPLKDLPCYSGLAASAYEKAS